MLLNYCLGFAAYINSTTDDICRGLNYLDIQAEEDFNSSLVILLNSIKTNSSNINDITTNFNNFIEVNNIIQSYNANLEI